MGNPFSEGSCFGFLSFAVAGIAAVAETSTPSENTRANERTMARRDLRIAEILGKNSKAGRSCSLMTLSCQACSGSWTYIYRITLGRGISCGSPLGVPQPNDDPLQLGKDLRQALVPLQRRRGGEITQFGLRLLTP